MEILGIDVGGTGIKSNIVNIESGTLTGEKFKLKTPTPSTPEAIIDCLKSTVENFNWTGKQIGIGFPAVIKNGISLTASNIDAKFINYNIDAELFSCVQNQVCRGNVELFVIFLQFIYKNRVFSDQQVESFVIQKDFKKIFENIDKQIIQGKIRVSNRFHKYFTHLKMLNAKSNKFSLFSVLYKHL